MVEGMQNLFSSFFLGGFKGDIVPFFGTCEYAHDIVLS
jgi:hypothetical protein